MILPAYEVTLKNDFHSISWSMYYDETCMADKAALHFLQHGGIEPELAHFLLRALKPGDLAVDVGANIGFISLMMSQLVGETGKVLAIEPGANNIDKFNQNMALNEVSNVQLFEVAAWFEDADLDFYLHIDSGRNSCAPDDKFINQLNVKGRKLDTLIPTVPKVIKIDAEGAEANILKGASRLLHSVPYWVMELNHIALAQFKLTRQDIRDFMHRRGYEMFLLRRDGEFPMLLPNNVGLRCEIENLNVLFTAMENIRAVWPEVALD